MKKIFKKFLVFSAILLSISSALLLTAPQQSAYADNEDKIGGCRYFLGMVSWDCYIAEKPSDQDQLISNIWVIAANILTDIIVIASYLVIGYVIYGGYLYLMSSGDPSKTAAGKKTITHAFIGLGIVMLSNVIIGAIRTALGANLAANCVTTECLNDNSSIKVLENAINHVIRIAGVVAVIFIVIGGISYITSSGDANKLKKAKDTILYAVIGLIIVALAQVLVTFVTSTLNAAEEGKSKQEKEKETSYLDQTILAKEYHEN